MGADRRGIGLDDIAAIVLEEHGQRRENHGGTPARRVARGRIIVLYDRPVGNDEATALVRTVWRR